MMVDIDGVISLFAAAGPLLGTAAAANEAGEGETLEGSFHSIEGIPHFLSATAAAHLLALGDQFELIWASGWEERANDHLPQIIGVPKLPYLRFDGRAQFGTAHWKLEALDEHAGSRALAWIDDSLDESCYEWAEERQAPTLLVPTESDTGLLDAHVEALEAWARDGFQPR
jgi:hypothetical protein